MKFESRNTASLTEELRQQVIIDTAVTGKYVYTNCTT